MALHPNKIIQAYIQGLLEVVDFIEEADDKGREYQALYQIKNPDSTGTNLTPTQITEADNFITAISKIRNSAFVAALKAKDHPSHGTKSLG